MEEMTIMTIYEAFHGLDANLLSLPRHQALDVSPAENVETGVFPLYLGYEPMGMGKGTSACSWIYFTTPALLRCSQRSSLYLHLVLWKAKEMMIFNDCRAGPSISPAERSTVPVGLSPLVRAR